MDTTRKEQELAGVKSCVINFLSVKAKNFNKDCIDEVLQMKHNDFGIIKSDSEFHAEFDPREHFGRIDCIDVDKFNITRYGDIYVAVLMTVDEYGTTNEKKKNCEPHFTKEQVEEFEKCSKMVMDWLDKNVHPHCTCIITNTECELVEGVRTVGNPKYANGNPNRYIKK